MACVSAAPTRSVLIVDDNEDVADLLSDYLSRAGVEVGTAYDAAGAWTKATKLRPEIVLLDLELPDERGDVLARRLREAGLARSIVAMTGHSRAFVDESFESGAFDGYLQKPCPLDQIDALLGIR